MTNDWWLGFLSGALATLLGFLFTMAWDIWKDRRLLKAREKSVESILGTDLASNLARIDRNTRALSQELEMLPKRMGVVQPLSLMRTSFWDVVRGHPPGELITEEQLISLHRIFDLTEEVNEQLRSRESFRQSNSAMTHFQSQMTIHDEELIKTMTSLKDSIVTLEGTKPVEGKSAPAA
jgi:hypothetical protein